MFAARLEAYGVRGMAEDVARAMGLELDAVSVNDEARTQLERALEAQGWHAANVARVLGPKPVFFDPAKPLKPAAQKRPTIVIVDEVVPELDADEEPAPHGCDVPGAGKRAAEQVQQWLSREEKLRQDDLRRRAKRRKSRLVRPSTVRERQVKADVKLEPYVGGRSLPMLRRDCADAPRPCLYVSCKFHLALDIEGGSIRFAFPDYFDGADVDRLDEMPATCALDIAARGGATLDEVGRLMNVTRERIRQIETRTMQRLKRRKDLGGIFEP